MTHDDAPTNPGNRIRLTGLTSEDIALIRAYACGSRIFWPADPTTTVQYDASAVERAVAKIAVEHDVTVTDLITAVYGHGEKAVAGYVEYSFRRQLAVPRQLGDAAATAQQNPADLAHQMYQHGLARRLIPGEHDEQAIHARLTTVARNWAHPDTAVYLPLLAGSDAYVVMRLREDGDDADLVQVPVAEPGACDYGITVCVDMDCVGSWSTDWQIIASQSNIDRRMRYVIHEGALPPIG